MARKTQTPPAKTDAPAAEEPAPAPAADEKPKSTPPSSFEDLVSTQAKLFTDLDSLVRTLKQNQRKLEQSFNKKLRDAQKETPAPTKTATSTTSKKSASTTETATAPAGKRKTVTRASKAAASQPAAAAEVAAEAD